MPREDERFRNLSPRHPEYCTCVECVQRRLQGNSDAGPGSRVKGIVGKLKGRAAGKIGAGKSKKRAKSGGSGKARGRSPAVAEPVRKHKPDCECATCKLLKSI